jgi:hypothetical protein
MRFPVVLALCLPLAGCFSVIAPKPVPEWAMVSSAETADEAPVRPRRTARVKRPAEAAPYETAAAPTGGTTDAVPSNMQPTALGHSVVRSKPTALAPAPARDVTAFSAEWRAREDARDANLLRSMGNVCRGC